MKALKKVLLGVLSVACVITASVGLTACGGGNGKDGTDGLEYYPAPDGYAVSQGNTMYLEEIVIPSTYKGKAVTMIADNAFEDANLTSIEIPDSVTSIGNSAFKSCSNLTSVVIPDGVTSIGSNTFEGCSNLTEMTLPFVGASKDGTSNTHFGYIFGASTNADNSSYVPISLKRVAITSATSIGERAFSGCRSLTSVVIPDGVTSIGMYAFRYCRSLTGIEIPDSVTSIGEGAFSSCDNLTSVVIGDSVTSIGMSAFSFCDNLTSVVIPDSVTSIGDYAFYYCSSLTNITVHENNASYKDIDGNLYTKDGATLIQYAVGKTDTSFIIPGSVTSIGSYAFSNCSSLTSVVIPDSVTSIGDCAFRDCNSLTSVVIPDSVTSIGSDAFRYCSKLTIYCERTSKPSAWSSSWDGSCSVVWGYKGA
jgi:hypothetical protein